MTRTYIIIASGDTPSFLAGKTAYTYSEILQELQKDEWQPEIV